MKKVKLLAWFLVGTALLATAFVRVTLADGPSSSSAALTGTVSSQAEGPMEGVLIGAKRTGSTISTWVVSNAQGQYSFPRDRMEAGHYAISIRAVGYELPATSPFAYVGMALQGHNESEPFEVETDHDGVGHTIPR